AHPGRTYRRIPICLPIHVSGLHSKRQAVEPGKAPCSMWTGLSRALKMGVRLAISMPSGRSAAELARRIREWVHHRHLTIDAAALKVLAEQIAAPGAFSCSQDE